VGRRHVVAAVSVAVVWVTVGACGGGEPSTTVTTPASPTSPAMQIPVGRAPEWVAAYCARAGRIVEAPVLCPTVTPTGIRKTGNLEALPPAPEGYVFEGEAGTHWVFGASPGSVEGDYGPMRHLGDTSVSGEAATWLAASESAGIHAGHLVLTWSSGGFHYVVSAHTDEPGSEPLRRALLEVASGMRSYR
jgi:hypothetical protein